MKKLYNFIFILFIIFSINYLLSNDKYKKIKFNHNSSIMMQTDTHEKIFCFNRKYYEKNISFINRDKDTLPSKIVSLVYRPIKTIFKCTYSIKHILINKNIYCISKIILRL